MLFPGEKAMCYSEDRSKRNKQCLKMWGKHIQILRQRKTPHLRTIAGVGATAGIQLHLHLADELHSLLDKQRHIVCAPRLAGQQRPKVRRLDQHACALLVLLEQLHDGCVAEYGPVQQQERFSVEVDQVQVHLSPLVNVVVRVLDHMAQPRERCCCFGLLHSPARVQPSDLRDKVIDHGGLGRHELTVDTVRLLLLTRARQPLERFFHALVELEQVIVALRQLLRR
mmetsp:Transcript_34294/g.101903  ORF Transcript_34294/g.101903 Transcript_34294/m.101903 type:complete len:226 (+) Transcript_34294:1812-2489(+)